MPNRLSPWSAQRSKVRLKLAVLLPLLLGAHCAWGTPILPVTVSVLDEVVIYPARSAPASVISNNDSRLSSEVSAVVERIPTQIGTVVEAGTPLVELNQADLKLEIRAAQATLDSLRAKQELAQDQYQRVRALAKNRTVTAELVGQRRTEAKVSESDLLKQKLKLKELSLSLEKTVIRAPFRAIVMEHLAHVGELATPGTPLIRVVDTTQVEISAQVQAYDIRSLERSINIRLLTERGSYPVRVHRIVPLIDERERSQEARLSFEGEQALIGSSGRLVWKEPLAYIPADLLVRRGVQIGIFLLEDDMAHFVPFADAQEGRPALNQLPADSIIIMDGRFVVKEGQPVTVKQQPQARRDESNVMKSALDDTSVSN